MFDQNYFDPNSYPLVKITTVLYKNGDRFFETNRGEVIKVEKQKPEIFYKKLIMEKTPDTSEGIYKASIPDPFW